MTRIQILRERAKALGLQIATYSPGDGVTRYRFFKLEDGLPGGKDYFSGRELHTALGRSAAETFMSGYSCGKFANR